LSKDETLEKRKDEEQDRAKISDSEEDRAPWGPSQRIGWHEEYARAEIGEGENGTCDAFLAGERDGGDGDGEEQQRLMVVFIGAL